MSNKLCKTDAKQLKKKNPIWNVLFGIALVMMIIAFIGIWIKVYQMSTEFGRQLTEMVEGKDYFMEEVVITKKDSDSYTSDDLGNSITNYYFYYNQSMDRKMFVTEDVYKEYQVGDSVPAYTMDHEYYGFTMESLLPQPDYRRNELSKAAGVLLGVGIVIVCLMKKIWD